MKNRGEKKIYDKCELSLASNSAIILLAFVP